MNEPAHECIHDKDPLYGTREPSQSRIEPVTRGQKSRLFILMFGKYRWHIDEDWPCKMPDGKVVVIPKGFVHDGASFPRSLNAIIMLFILTFIENKWLLGASIFAMSYFMLSVFHPMGRAMIPGIVHDYLYRYDTLTLDNGEPYMRATGLWKADNLFLQIYLNRHETIFFALLTTYGMKVGSWAAWAGHRKNIDLSKEAPIP